MEILFFKIIKMKFNKKDAVVNHEGGKAYLQSPEQELYLLVCNSILEDTYYESTNERLIRLRELLQKVSAEFAVNLTAYARKKMYLRSITHVLVVEIAKIHKKVVAKLIERVCERVDDMTEILSYQLKTYGKPIPNQIKKGLARTFSKFSEYQLAKYDRKGNVTLRDLIFLTHVKRSELTDKVINDELKVPYTWETELSSKGNKKEVWEELINSGKLGYMALLRNLRNILAVCQGKEIEKVINTLKNPEAVKNSKQFPFRFWSAYRELQNPGFFNPFTDRVLSALEEACGISVENLNLHGVSLVAADVSGSMQKPISLKSKVQMIDIGLVLQGLAKKIAPTSVSMIFGDNAKLKSVSGGVFSSVLNYKEGEVGYATNGYKVIEYLNNEKIKVDNILFFTDGEMYGGDIQGELVKYRSTVNKDVKVFVFNLAGYKTVQFPGNSVYTIGGWSERIFDFIEAVEDNKVINIIKNYSL